MIPQNILDEIQNKTDIVEVISQYISLKKAGRNYKANCPFHSEKTPSFVVSADKQIFHCFGCGAGGNVFAFLMKHEHIDFLDAVRMLAKKTGVNLPEVKNLSSGEINVINELYKINELAADYYSTVLKSTAHGKNVIQYLLNRNISEETINEFRLGCSLKSQDAFIAYCKRKGMSVSVISKAGLASNRGGSDAEYDMFRNRLILPIFDFKGKVIAFGARVLDDSLPKYINSPETPVYSKSSVLYGLHKAKPHIVKEKFVIIVEGYFDFLSAYQSGVKNIVASCGTALTPQQARMLKKITSQAIIIYDGDPAGKLASLRNLDILVEEDFRVKIADMPEGFDPDSLVRKKGIKEFVEVVKQSQDLFDYKLKVLCSQYDKNKSEEKIKIIGEMIPTLAKVKNAVLQNEYLRKLAFSLQVDEESLKQEFNKASKLTQTKRDEAGFQKSDTLVNDTKQANHAERIVVMFMLANNEIAYEVKKHLDISDFENDDLRQIARLIYNLIERGEKIEASRVISYLGNDDKNSSLVAGLLAESEYIVDVKKALGDCVLWLKKRRASAELKKIQEQIRQAQEIKDELEVKKLMHEYAKLMKTVKG